MLAEGKSDTGQVRKINEDSYLILNGTAAQLYAVADGMGGHKSGEVASSLAVEILQKYFAELLAEHHSAEEWEDHLRTAFVQANREILTLSMENDQHNGMGTTLTAAVVDNNDLYVSHIGDSRLYILHDGSIKKITDDHSLVAELLRQGEITLEEAKDHPRKNILLRALGIALEMELAFYHCQLANDDFLLLATDGLTNLLGEQEILQIAEKFVPLEAVDKMIELANVRGGHDNITVILAKR